MSFGALDDIINGLRCTCMVILLLWPHRWMVHDRWHYFSIVAIDMQGHNLVLVKHVTQRRTCVLTTRTRKCSPQHDLKLDAGRLDPDLLQWARTKELRKWHGSTAFVLMSHVIPYRDCALLFWWANASTALFSIAILACKIVKEGDRMPVSFRKPVSCSAFVFSMTECYSLDTLRIAMLNRSEWMYFI